MTYRFKPPLIYVHGGAGGWKVDEETKLKVLKCLGEAAITGYEALVRGCAVDGVVEAVRFLEDSGLFNAGIGSVLTVKGTIEMDAGLMDGRSLKAGAVACVSRVKNPILLARIVLEKTDHVLIVGDFAEELARVHGLEEFKGPLPKRVERYRELIGKLDEVKYWKKLKELVKLLGIEFGGTVGAVAVDSDGNVAAASSTGGVWLKLPGRIGDTPIPGAGFYADNGVGAATATGLGEYIVLYGLSRKVVEYMSNGLNPMSACIKAIEELSRVFERGSAGVIAVDVNGFIGSGFNTNAMPRAVMSKDLHNPVTVFSKERNM